MKTFRRNLLRALCFLMGVAALSFGLSSFAAEQVQPPLSSMRSTCENPESAWMALRASEARAGTRPGERSRWFAAKGSTVASALVIHGLNHNPSKMNTLAEFLSDNGVQALRMTLSGHGGSLAAMKQVSRAGWLADVASAYCVVASESQGKPIFLVAFSLGALVALDAENDPEYDFVHFDRNVLFAPAFGAKGFSRVMSWIPLPASVVVPSIGSTEYRANSGTTLAAYSATWDSVDVVRERGIKKTTAPTLVFLDRKDELVGLDEIETFRKSNQHIKWKIIVIDVSPAADIKPKHHHPLITEPRGTGEENWKHITEEVRAHLLGP